jgi:hypothetical protein
MKKLLIAGAAGAAVVFVASKGGAYLAKPGTDGKPPLGDFAAKYGPLLAGAAAGILLSKFAPSAV